MRPKSSTTTYLTTSTFPVSGSISTSQTWQPFGKVEMSWLKVAPESRPVLPGRRAAAATSMIDMDRLEPAERKNPSENSMSSPGSPSSSATTALPLSITWSADSRNAPATM